MDIIYRQGNLKDLYEINLLVEHAIIHMQKQNIMQWDEIYPTSEDFEQDIKKNQLYVGCIDDKIIVVFTINQEYDDEYKNGAWNEPDKPFCIIHRLCVHPMFQNMGVARNAMEYIERKVLFYGSEAIRLDVYSQNPNAIKLYLDCGYRRVGIAQWRKGTFYLMEKSI